MVKTPLSIVTKLSGTNIEHKEILDANGNILFCTTPSCNINSVKEIEEALEIKKVLNELELSIDELVDIASAKSEGRVVILPCRPGDKAYTINRNDCPCEVCVYGEKVGYSPLNCEYECPPPQYTINTHICEGFTIRRNADGNWIVSYPGEWDYGGLEEFYGCDGNIYYHYEDAKKAMEMLRNNN